MNRVFGIILCIFSLVGLVSSPALAAISCAMQCQKSQSAIEVPVTDMASSADSMSEHCAKIAAAAATVTQLDSGTADTGGMFTGMDCDCPASCTLTAPAVISNVEVSLHQQLNGDIFMFGLNAVEESFRSRLYRPPIA